MQETAGVKEALRGQGAQGMRGAKETPGIKKIKIILVGALAKRQV